MTAKLKSALINNYPLFLIIALYFCFIFPYFNFVPMWDGWVYFESGVYHAVSSPFSLSNFDFAGHISTVFGLIVSLPQYLFFGSTTTLHLTTVFFLLLSLLAFSDIIITVFALKSKNPEYYILMILYLFYPVVSASTLQLNPDIYVMFFFLFLLKFLLHNQILPAVFSGLAMMFSKESGIALYLITCFYYLIAQLAGQKNWRNSIFLLMRKFFLPVLPVLIYAAYFVISMIINRKADMLVWLRTPIQPHYITIPEEIPSRVPFSYLTAIFILNFNWIMTLFLLMGIIYWMFHIFRKNNKISLPLVQISFIMLTFITSTAVFMTYRIFTNPRYFLPLYPVLIILSYYGLVSIMNNRTIRRITLLVMSLLILLSNIRTFDPLSKMLFGTFNFGNHKLLKMTGITHDCCGYGRDQLVYNLEYTNIHYLLNQIFADIKPTDESVFAFAPLEGPNVINRINKKTFERTLGRADTINIDNNTNLFIWRPEMLPKQPEKVYFIEFPNNDNAPYLNSHLVSYNLEQEKEYNRGGYKMKVYTMDSKQKD